VINISLIFGISGGFGVLFVYYVVKGVVWIFIKNVVLYWVIEGVCVNFIYFGFIVMLIFE